MDRGDNGEVVVGGDNGGVCFTCSERRARMESLKPKINGLLWEHAHESRTLKELDAASCEILKIIETLETERKNP